LAFSGPDILRQAILISVTGDNPIGFVLASEYFEIMSITIPKPGALKPFLTKPKIPGLVAIGLLAAQYLLFGPGTSPEPRCALNVEYVHESTHLKEKIGELALKLNITSECNVEQKSTTLNASIDQILHSKQTTVVSFDNVTALSSNKDKTKAHFLDLLIGCKKSPPIMYGGYAEGSVLLKNGQEMPVKGFSKEFKAVSCEVKAK
jgi:hypothetical protein